MLSTSGPLESYPSNLIPISLRFPSWPAISPLFLFYLVLDTGNASQYHDCPQTQPQLSPSTHQYAARLSPAFSHSKFSSLTPTTTSLVSLQSTRTVQTRPTRRPTTLTLSRPFLRHLFLPDEDRGSIAAALLPDHQGISTRALSIKRLSTSFVVFSSHRVPNKPQT